MIACVCAVSGCTIIIVVGSAGAAGGTLGGSAALRAASHVVFVLFTAATCRQHTYVEEQKTKCKSFFHIFHNFPPFFLLSCRFRSASMPFFMFPFSAAKAAGHKS